jgi:uncharacterized membrane protein
MKTLEEKIVITILGVMVLSVVINICVYGMTITLSAM